jgi:hypothetical protein
METPGPSLSGKLSFYLSRAEQALLGLALIGLVLKYANLPWTMVLTISLAGLTAVFFLSAFTPPDQQKLAENTLLSFKDLLAFTIAPKVLGISCAVSAIGILFFLQNLKGHQQLVMIGGVSIAFGLLVLGYGFMTDTKNIRTMMPWVYRAIPLGCLDAYIFLQNSYSMGILE